MTAVGGLVLVLGLLVSARCEVRARDPEVEEDEERGRGGGGGGRGGGGGGGGVEGFPPHPERLHPGVTQTPPLGERGNYPARTGNWCAFVQRRVVTKAVVCGSEKYVMKSQSPCPSGAPDCQLPMYKLSSRPLYRQKEQIYSALLWHCCPGHSGRNCEDSASDTQLDSASSDLIGGSGPVRTELHVPGVQLHRLHQRDDPNREQNDHQAPYDTGDPNSLHTTPPPALHRDHGRHHTAPAHPTPPPALHRDHGRHHTASPALHRDHGRHHTAHAAGSTRDHQHHLHHGQQELHRPGFDILKYFTTIQGVDHLSSSNNPAAGGFGETDGASKVRESVASMASEQSGSRSLDQRLTQLSRSLAAALADISALTEADRKQRDEMQRLSASFQSLLTDAVRHSDVLEILLGEEVLEFLDWPVQDQEAHSIPALKETLRGHEQSITALLDRKTGDREEIPSADQPPPSSSLLSDGWHPAGGAARERQRLLQPADGSDLWNIEKTVEELKIKVLQLEETMLSGEGHAALHAEVTWLKRGLEEHLRTFKNVFSNADVLASSDATLELDKLWQLLQIRDEKKEKKKKGGNHRSRRETTGETTGVAPVPSSQSGASVLLAAGGDAQRRRHGWN
ncbi:multimerin-2a [Sander vitreus]